MLKTLLSFSAVLALLASTSTAREVWLTLDHARPLEFEVPVGSIVVGNPAIADVNVRSTRDIVMFGKMPGQTNIYVFDRDGDQIQKLFVRVKNPEYGMVTLQAGPTRYSFSCVTVCEQTFTVGDGTNESRLTNGNIGLQAQERYGLATGNAGGAAASDLARTGPQPQRAPGNPQPGS